MSDIIERRDGPRSEMAATANVFRGDRCIGMYLVENLAAGGALLTGPPLLEVGNSISVLLQLAHCARVAIPAQVVRQQPLGEEVVFAVAFRHATSETEEMVHEAVLTMLERLHGAPERTVLVVDSSPKVRGAMEKDLRALGRRVISVATPLEAVTRLQNPDIRIGAAVVDFFLGNGSGLELLAFLADDCPKVRRVLMSGHLRQYQLHLALASGRAHAILPKPWDRGHLADVLVGKA